MSEFTIGEFKNSLEEITTSLGAILEKLEQCNLDVELERTPGRSAICSGPVIIGSACAKAVKEEFTVRDLAETIGALRDWVSDVTSKLSVFDPSVAFDAAQWPSTDEDTSA